MTSSTTRQFVAGLTNPKGNLGDFQHASRLFVDADLRLAPKVKFLFHVVFSINTAALKNLDFKYRHQNEINMLVKKVDLPSYQINTATLNQYNRKRVVQTKIDYQPINITFHDDNLGVTRQLWENYYSYYYADPTTAKATGTYKQTAMLSGINIRNPYGFDNNSTIRFFDKITIYQMAKKKWNSYTLVNPLITSWKHDTMDYSQSNGIAENQMSVIYEAVTYDSGNVAQNNPPGFGIEHYDTTPSPISLPGGGSRSVFGEGGVLAGIEQVTGDIASGTAFESPINFLATAIKAVNTYQNAASLTSVGVQQEITNIAVRGLGAIANAGVSGVYNTTFPVNDNNLNGTTVASPISLGGI